MVLYLRDINLPKPDKYSTMQVIAFLQQLLTYKGFYDDKLEFIGEASGHSNLMSSPMDLMYVLQRMAWLVTHHGCILAGYMLSASAKPAGLPPAARTRCCLQPVSSGFSWQAGLVLGNWQQQMLLRTNL